ncbi:MAG TPA: enolase C-terminal domain-like protein [Nocardioides sp.]|nr:enolase C-terminal domain-like protein [Nocardioides sp.]
MPADAAVDAVTARACTVPTDAPESDGTLEWDATTIVVVTVTAEGVTGLGYTYCDAAAARLVDGLLADVLRGRDALDVGGAWAAMWQAIRNLGQSGIAAMAVSALDIALWDLKARLLGVPLVVALDATHEAVPAYGSGGFCSYSDHRLGHQLSGWAESGFRAVKIKVGRRPDLDEHRVRVARQAIGPDVALYVDANGALTRGEARRWAQLYARRDVRWFEEPVSSDDVDGLRAVRDATTGGVEIAAGEYGWALPHFRHLLDAGAVDCLQADVTRCGGITGFRRVAALADAYGVDLSAHCAPQVSAHAACSVWHPRHVEWFHDHVRIERLLFDGCLDPVAGRLTPDRERPGHGLALDEVAAERWAA